MKILFSSNSPWCPSGYGVQSKLLIEFLKKYGHEIVFLSNFGLMGGSLRHDDVLYLPDDVGTWGNNSIKYHAAMQKPDVILTLMDWFVYDCNEWNTNGIPWINWTPIDLIVDKKFDRLQTYLKNCFGIVALSNFGSEQLTKAGRQPNATIYHAINSSVFKILDKNIAKATIGLPQDSYVIGINMANKDASEDRKAFGEQFQGIKKFIDKHPELNCILYIHSEPSEKYNGHNLIKLLNERNFDLNKVIFTNPMQLNMYPHSTEMMAILYNSFDVLINASSGEGFGVPIIEAQACGTPVVTHAATSMTELTFNGYAAKSNPKSKIPIEKYGHRFKPNINDIVNGLEFVLQNSDKEKNREVSNYVRETFDIDIIGLQWLQLIDILLNGVDARAAKGSGL